MENLIVDQTTLVNSTRPKTTTLMLTSQFPRGQTISSYLNNSKQITSQSSRSTALGETHTSVQTSSLSTRLMTTTEQIDTQLSTETNTDKQTTNTEMSSFTSKSKHFSNLKNRNLQTESVVML